MKCLQVRSVASEHVDGLLDAELSEAIDRHVETCASCADIVERITEAVDALALLGPVEPSESLVARLARAVPPPSRKVAPLVRPRTSRELLRVAGFLIVAFGLAWQMGAGSVAARALGDVAPVFAEARQRAVRTRLRGEAFLDELRPRPMHPPVQPTPARRNP